MCNVFLCLTCFVSGKQYHGFHFTIQMLKSVPVKLGLIETVKLSS